MKHIQENLPDMNALVAMDLHQNLHAKQCCHSLDLSLKQTST